MTDFELIKVPGRFVVTKNPLFANTVPVSQYTMDGIVNSSSKPLPGESERIIKFIKGVAFPPEALVGNPARPIRVPYFERLLKGSSTSMQSDSSTSMQNDPISVIPVASADNVLDSTLSISTSEENNNPFLPENSGADRGFTLFENQNDIPVVNPADAMDFSSSYPDEIGNEGVNMSSLEDSNNIPVANSADAMDFSSSYPDKIGDEEVNMSSFDENSNDIPVANSTDGVMDSQSSYPDEIGNEGVNMSSLEDSNNIPVANSADEVMDPPSSYLDEDTISVNSERFKGLSDDMGASVTGGVERALNELIVSTRLSDPVATENPITSDADRSVELADRDTVLVAPDVERVDGNQQTVDANKSGAVVLDLDFASLRTNLKAAQDALQKSREALEQARNARNTQRDVCIRSRDVVVARRLEAMKRETLKNQRAAEKCRKEAEKFTTEVDELDAMFSEMPNFDMNGGHSYSKAA